MTMPEKLQLASLPTPIEKLNRLSAELGTVSVYIKRDDHTGMEWSGNKIRKLEYTLKEALSQGCDTLITCGGNQSNHCRATAAAAARLGLESCLVLRGTTGLPSTGNLMLDRLFGAEIRFISPEDYATRRGEIMETIRWEKEKQGKKAYIIPEGASNGIGSMGYYNAFLEIAAQEKEMNLQFDAIVVAVGSGGTYAGLLLGKALTGHSAELPGYLVGGSREYFEGETERIFGEFRAYTDKTASLPDTNFVDGYIGRGYGLNVPEEIEFIKYFARLEGIVLDNVYTGKAMYGLVTDIRKGKYTGMKNILFIHTGGLFEMFSQSGF